MSNFVDRLNQRQKDFKKASDPDDARRKREDAAVQLRKASRDEALQKKRFTDGPPMELPQVTDSIDMVVGDSTNPQTAAMIVTLAQVLLSPASTPDAVFNATQQLRKMLSVEQNPPIQEVIQTGVIPRLVDFLKEVQKPELQFEAEWVLTNIASGTAEQTRAVVDAGALPVFVQLLESPGEDVKEQAVWALGNIAGDSPHLRDLVLQSGGLMPIMQVLMTSEKTSTMRNATWTLSNLARGKPPPPFEWVQPALPTLAQLIQSTDVEVLTDACWAFSYLSDGPNDRITAVIQAGVLGRLVKLLSHSSSLVQTPALRALGNVVTGDDTQTQAVIENGALKALLPLLDHQSKNIKKEACWAISNITAGSQAQIQEVINCGAIPLVIHLLQTADFDIKKEAAWVISNATAGGLPQQIEYLVECGCIKPMVDLLAVHDTKIITVALEALENILRTGKQHQQEQGLADNPVALLVEQADGLNKIEALQEDTNEEVFSKAVNILANYFPLEEDDIDGIDTSEGAMQFGQAVQVPVGGFHFGPPAS